MGGRASRSKLPEGALLDNADLSLLEGRAWRIGNHGYVQAKSLGKSYLLHRLVMGAGTGQFIDHINRNRLDNRRSNLRFCTPSQNGVNKRVSKLTATSKYRGVYWYKRVSKWLARVSVKRQLIWSGYYSTELAAAIAFDNKMVEIHGAFYVRQI